MTIEEYLKTHEDFDIDTEFELDFVDVDSDKEAKQNIEWVINNEPTLERLMTVIRSYHGTTIDWW